MNDKASFLDFKNRKFAVVFKRSRYEYAKEHGSKTELNFLKASLGELKNRLENSHQNNLSCIKHVEQVLQELNLDYQFFSRSDLKASDIKKTLVISIGGDGTLLDASHYCIDSPILGVNSDPENSVGLLCGANQKNFKSILTGIMANKIKPMSIARLNVKISGKIKEQLALNDVLFCHQNPAAMTRFKLEFKGRIESHRSSGIWVSSAAGSTGGIYSAGAKPINLDEKKAIFRLREPYWCDKTKALLHSGNIAQEETLKITSEMSDGKLFLDGPHKASKIGIGQSIEISLSKNPLWLFEESLLAINRKKLIEKRKRYRSLFI